MNNTTNTSAQSLDALGMSKRKSQGDLVYDVVRAHCVAGGGDMSGREIQAEYEAVHGRRIDSGTVSARVNALVTAKRLVRSAGTRKCTITGADIHPVLVVAQQARLVN